jgi:hypothetical protein
MSKKEFKLTLEEHKKLGINFFNKIWSFIENKDRLPEDDEMMLHYAHASTLHWILSDCPKVNKQRGFWILSRVYSLLNRPESALIYGKLCLDYIETPTEDNGFAQFDVAYANEAMARAYAISGNKANFEKYYNLARIEGDKITDEGDKKYWDSDFASEPWNGMV